MRVMTVIKSSRARNDRGKIFYVLQIHFLFKNPPTRAQPAGGTHKAQINYLFFSPTM